MTSQPLIATLILSLTIAVPAARADTSQSIQELKALIKVVGRPEDRRDGRSLP
jgi:hypothetical protein